MSEHRIGLVEQFHLAREAFQGDAHVLSQNFQLLGSLGQELMERRVKDADDDRQPSHLLKDRLKVVSLHREEPG